MPALGLGQVRRVDGPASPDSNGSSRLDPALAAILLVVAFHDGLHSWLEAALACIDHHQDTEVRRVDVGVREVASTREVLLDVGLMW